MSRAWSDEMDPVNLNDSNARGLIPENWATIWGGKSRNSTWRHRAENSARDLSNGDTLGSPCHIPLKPTDSEMEQAAERCNHSLAAGVRASLPVM
jgi:hypothetical protein